MKNQKLSKMEADYGDVVPRRDFEKLDALHKVNICQSCLKLDIPVNIFQSFYYRKQ